MDQPSGRSGNALQNLAGNVARRRSNLGQIQNLWNRLSLHSHQGHRLLACVSQCCLPSMVMWAPLRTLVKAARQGTLRVLSHFLVWATCAYAMPWRAGRCWSCSATYFGQAREARSVSSARPTLMMSKLPKSSSMPPSWWTDQPSRWIRVFRV